jgi:hypothetical protein
MMLAMLVPAAMAAPEDLAGVSIQAPTTAAPVWVKSPGTFKVEYTINVSKSQVVPVNVYFYLLDLYNVTVDMESTTIDPPLPVGPNAKTWMFGVPADLPDGYYHLKVCITDGHDPMCTTQPRSVRIDKTAPEPVVLEKPIMDRVCAWVTGDKYELFGYAIDNFEVKKAWFEYVDELGNDPLVIPATAVAGQPGEYWAEWNSSDVPDTSPADPGYMRFCAEDLAGNVACSAPDWKAEEHHAWAPVCIENRVKVDLAKGWNLISTPLLLYKPAVADVLENVWCPAGNPSCIDGGGWKYPYQGIPVPIDMIYAYDGAAWSQWVKGGPDGIGTIDDGKGYWVHTVAPATIEFFGTWSTIGPVSPPEYAVGEGWNLIGYTHWGLPTDNGYWKLVSEYLGFPMMVSVESMYRYNAGPTGPSSGYWISVDEMTGEQFMVQGAGYWLALAEGAEGTINP